MKALDYIHKQVVVNAYACTNNICDTTNNTGTVWDG